jgi:hypothetical protein
VSQVEAYLIDPDEFSVFQPLPRRLWPCLRLAANHQEYIESDLKKQQVLLSAADRAETRWASWFTG